MSQDEAIPAQAVGPAEILILPYSAATGRSLLHVLIEELRSKHWTRFQAAVAFVKTSGNVTDLLAAMDDFCEASGRIDLTFGADNFSGDNKGSDYEAVEELLQAFQDRPLATLHLYHEKGRTFHPKIYLFDNEVKKTALLILGSSNWSKGGLATNVEANILIRLNLANAAQCKVYDDAQKCFTSYWKEPPHE